MLKQFQKSFGTCKIVVSLLQSSCIHSFI